MPGAHALLSPSGASRWLECTPSARLEETQPERSSIEASEGTLAHEMAEVMMSVKLKIMLKKEYDSRMKVIRANPLHSFEMTSLMDDFTDYVMELYHADLKASKSGADVFLETRLDMTKYVPEGFGTGDIITICEGKMRMIDLKYGKGVKVEAFENKQMMLYALGALEAFWYLYPVQEIEMIIYQPRMNNISSYTMTVEKLRTWAEEYLKPRAKLAFAGEGEFSPGAACQFCRAKAVCRANAEYNLELLKYDFKHAELLTDQEISDIMDKASNFTSWLNAVTSHALTEALAGKKWPNYKLVEGRSVRVLGDEKAIAGAMAKAGFTEDEFFTKKLVGIGALEKLLGKSDFETLLGGWVSKPPGKPTLVHESDKRQELQTSLENDFKHLI